MSKFKYETKETYTQEDLEQILQQHHDFAIKGTVPKTEYEKLISELNPLKTEKRFNHIKSLTSSLNVKSEMADDLIKLSNISPEMEDKDIISSLSETLKTRPFFIEQEDSTRILAKGKNDNQTEHVVRRFATGK